MHPIESRIIPLLQGKHNKGIELLYEHYADTLFGVIKTIVKDDSLAKDVLQESFVKIWKKGHLYDSKKSRLFTWLVTIVRNTAIDKIRSVQNRSGKEIQMPDYDVNSSGTTSLSVDTLDVKDHMEHLELKYKLVIHALFFQGMTQREASKALDIPLGTVKSRLRFGMKQLRKIFGDSEITIILLIMMML